MAFTITLAAGLHATRSTAAGMCPHFEKMLYDNAQLLGLYAEAYTWQPDPLYKEVAGEIARFVERELMSPQYGFYSALDADSESVEGKFYTFTGAEIDLLLGTDAEIFKICYHVTAGGNWEEEATNVFFRKENDTVLAEKLGLEHSALTSKIAGLKKIVFEERAKRIRPGLDNKIIASWNGLMLKGLCNAYRAFDDPYYLNLALKNAEFITANLLTESDRLIRIFKNNTAQIGTRAEAFLDDYANVADAFIALYEVTFDEQWLHRAKKITDQCYCTLL